MRVFLVLGVCFVLQIVSSLSEPDAWFAFGRRAAHKAV